MTPRHHQQQRHETHTHNSDTRLHRATTPNNTHKWDHMTFQRQRSGYTIMQNTHGHVRVLLGMCAYTSGAAVVLSARVQYCWWYRGRNVAAVWSLLRQYGCLCCDSIAASSLPCGGSVVSVCWQYCVSIVPECWQRCGSIVVSIVAVLVQLSGSRVTVVPPACCQ